MHVLPEKYKELASHAGRYPKLRMEMYAGTRGAWTDTVEAEYNGENAIVSATYTNGVTTKPSRFETGLAFCGSLEIELHGVQTAAFAAGKRFRLFSGFYDPETGETAEASVGEFFIESTAVENGKVTVKARDKMMFAEQKFNATALTYPCTLLDCVREIFRQMGFTMPEDYTLDINPTVRAPAWQKPNMTEGVYEVRGGSGYFFVEDPQGYDIKMPGASKMTKGHVYSAAGFALTCREALASAAKMQLGNCFIDGDGIPRFSSYRDAPPLGDDRVTGLTVGEENFTIRRITYNYRGYDEESVNLFKRAATEWRGDLMYYTNFPSDLPESYDPVRLRAVGQTFREGTVERKGVGEVEIGEFLNYAGKMGNQRFFIFGKQYEWSGASFDETLYSFAPDYKGVDYEWMNDRDLVADEDQGEEPVEDKTPAESETPETGESGISIAQAVVIKESDAKYLLHDFTEIEYNAGNRIGYAGPGNQIIVGGYLAYYNENLGGKLVYGNTVLGYTEDEYEEFLRDKVRQSSCSNLDIIYTYNNKEYTEIGMDLIEATTTYLRYDAMLKSDEENYHLNYFNVNNNIPNGILLKWDVIYPPGYKYANKTFEYGAARMTADAICSPTAAEYAKYKAIRSILIPNTRYLVTGFKNLSEYNAAVGLTYEPLTLTRVEDNPTVVSGKDGGEEVT